MTGPKLGRVTASIDNVDFHYLTEYKGYKHIGVVVNGKEWIITISPKGTKITVSKN